MHLHHSPVFAPKSKSSNYDYIYDVRNTNNYIYTVRYTYDYIYAVVNSYDYIYAVLNTNKYPQSFLHWRCTVSYNIILDTGATCGVVHNLAILQAGTLTTARKGSFGGNMMATVIPVL